MPVGATTFATSSLLADQLSAKLAQAAATKAAAQLTADQG